VESLGKLHRYILSNTEKELSYIKIHEEDYIKNLVNIVTVNNENQYDDLSDDIDLYDEGESDADFTLQDPSAISQLDIEGTVDLLP
jgi:hypothetical protein